MVAPCVNVLRNLANNIKKVLGQASQGTRHSAPDLSVDIAVLMDSLKEHKVYEKEIGRTLEDEDEVADVVSIGALALIAEGGPLDEYNKAFKRLQQRRRMRPVVGDGVNDMEKGSALSPSPPSPPPRMSPSAINQAQDAPLLAAPLAEHDSDGGREEEEEESSDSEVEKEEEELEFDRIFATEDATLTLDTAEDVALDMDAVVSDDDVLDEDGSDMD